MEVNLQGPPAAPPSSTGQASPASHFPGGPGLISDISPLVAQYNIDLGTIARSGPQESHPDGVMLSNGR